MVLGRTEVRPGERILLAEDVVTTGKTTKLTAQSVEEAGGIIHPYLLALVNRSGQDEIDGRKVVALINEHMPVWSEEECPLCRQGSEPVKPKDIWRTFTAA
jgi:orotate phosphoribosyltransferase